MKDAIATILSRKSVRVYSDKPVTKLDLETLIKAGMAAPSAKNQRPWGFVAITDRAILNALADVMEYGKMLKNAGAAIAVCGCPDKNANPVLQEYWVQDCSAAAQNILLAAEAIGLGAVWLGVHPRSERVKDVKNILKIPNGVIPLNIISIGHPAGSEKLKDKFEPAKIHWNGW